MGSCCIAAAGTRLDRAGTLGHDRKTMPMRNGILPAIKLSTIQLLRKRVLMVGMILLGGLSVVVHSTWADEDVLHERIEWVGIFLIVVCIVGRTWCSYYISGRKDVTLVTVGPYSPWKAILLVFGVIGIPSAGVAGKDAAGAPRQA